MSPLFSGLAVVLSFDAFFFSSISCCSLPLVSPRFLFSLPPTPPLFSTTSLSQTQGCEKVLAEIAISSPLMWLLDKTVKIRFLAICFICELSRVSLSSPDTSLAKLPGRSGYFEPLSSQKRFIKSFVRDWAQPCAAGCRRCTHRIGGRAFKEGR